MTILFVPVAVANVSLWWRGHPHHDLQGSGAVSPLNGMALVIEGLWVGGSAE